MSYHQIINAQKQEYYYGKGDLNTLDYIDH